MASEEEQDVHQETMARFPATFPVAFDKLPLTAEFPFPV
jgi:hypothetical protein